MQYNIKSFHRCINKPDGNNIIKCNGKRDLHHLINKTSPNLLQPAENPMDWHPWCSEAFEKAHVADKQVFRKGKHSILPVWYRRIRFWQSEIDKKMLL